MVCQGEMSPMLKTLTMSLSLAAALGLCSVSKAGGWFDKDTDVKPVGLTGFGSAQSSPQCAKPSSQCLPSPQCNFKFCNPLPGWKNNICGFCSKLKPKPACYTYEWTLKKKRVWFPPSGLPSSQCSPQSGCSPRGGYSGRQYARSSGAQAGTGGGRTPAATATDTEAPKAPEAPEA